jgi:hypothetical protein
MNENDHPKGALLFMLVYLALLAFMWTNLYLNSGRGEGRDEAWHDDLPL